MNNIVNIFSYIMQIFIANDFFSLFGEKREIKDSYRAIFFIFLILLGSFNTLFIKNQLLFTLVSFVFLFINSFIFKMAAGKRLYSSVFLSLVLILGEMIFGMIFCLIYNVDIQGMQENLLIYVQAVFLTKLLTYVIIRIIRKKFNFKNQVDKNILFSFILLPITTFVVLFSMTKLGVQSTSMQEKLYVLTTSILMILCNFVVFYIYDYIIKTKEKQYALSQETRELKYQNQYYNELYEKQELTKKTIHNMKNSLITMSDIIQKEPQKAIEIINKMYNQFEGSIKRTITAIEPVDALLGIKENVATKNDIDIEIKAYINKIKGIETIDLCVLFGNLLDNCIEACGQIEEKSNRYIKMTITENIGFISITIENSKVCSDLAVTLESSKKNKELHGYGIKSIKEIVKKYNGEFCFKCEVNKVVVNVVLQME